MIVGEDGPAVLLSPRTCAVLESQFGLSNLRTRVRGKDPLLSKELTELRTAALLWRSSATGTTDDTEPEPAAESSQWLTTGQAADLAGVTSRAIRKAIAEARLPAVEVSGRYRISREDLEHFKSARSAA